MDNEDSLDQLVNEFTEDGQSQPPAQAGDYLHILSAPLEILKTTRCQGADWDGN